MPKGGGGGRAKNCGALFFKIFDYLRLSKSAVIENNIKGPNKLSEANSLTIYTGLLHFAKYHYLRLKVLCNCPK